MSPQLQLWRWTFEPGERRSAQVLRTAGSFPKLREVDWPCRWQVPGGTCSCFAQHRPNRDEKMSLFGHRTIKEATFLKWLGLKYERDRKIDHTDIRRIGMNPLSPPPSKFEPYRLKNPLFRFFTWTLAQSTWALWLLESPWKRGTFRAKLTAFHGCFVSKWYSNPFEQMMNVIPKINLSLGSGKDFSYFFWIVFSQPV